MDSLMRVCGLEKCFPHSIKSRKRLKKAARQDFIKTMISRHNASKLPKIEDIQVVGVNNVNAALRASLMPAPKEK